MTSTVRGIVRMRADVGRIASAVFAVVGAAACGDHSLRDSVAAPPLPPPRASAPAIEPGQRPPPPPVGVPAQEQPQTPAVEIDEFLVLGPVVAADAGPIAAPFLTSKSSPSRKADSVPNGKSPWLACDAALDWLVRHQAADGSWDAAKRGRLCNDAACESAPGRSHVIGDTSVALMAISATGWGAPRARAFDDGLAYLLSVQRADGSFGASSTDRRVLDQALATEALCRTLGEKSADAHRVGAKRAAEHLLSLRTPNAAWRSDGAAGGPSELQVTTWATMALADARAAEVRVPRDVYRDVLVWLATEPGGRTAAAASMRVCCRLFCGTHLRDAKLAPDLEILRSAGAADGGDRPGSGAAGEYFATVAEFYWGGDAWKDRLRVHFPMLLRRQLGQDDGCRMGSWDAVGPEGEADRVEATALTSMLFDCAYISTYRNVMDRPLIPK